MGAFDLLTQSSERVVEAGGMRWRLRVPSTRDLLAAGGVGLIAAVDPGDSTPAIQPSGADALARGAEMLAQADAMICASVIGAGAGDEIEPLSLVRELAAESRDLGRVWVERLSPQTRMALVAEVAALLADGGRLAAAAATFRGSP
jgi:hypothetical protein